MQVERQLTQVGESEAARALLKVLPNHLSGDAFIREVAELTLAQVWLQSGQGQVFNHNWGQVPPLSDDKPFFRPPWYDKEEVELLPEETELEKRRKGVLLSINSMMVEGKAPQRLQAFTTSLEGLDEYIRRLSEEVGDALKSGEISELITALGDHGRDGPLDLYVRRFRKASFFAHLRSKK